MLVEEFRKRDVAFLDWIVAHPRGFVINIQQSLNPSDARVHYADCETIARAAAKALATDGSITRHYIKECSLSLAELDAWAGEHVGAPIRRCGTCRPPREAGSTAPTPTSAPIYSSRTVTRGPAEPANGAGLYESEISDEVWLWGDHYIPFQDLTSAQVDARSRLLEGLRSLHAKPGQILHATYAGAKPKNTDVENLVLYNVDMGGASLLASCRYGVRFEVAGGARRRPPSGRIVTCSYQYRLIPASTDLTHWRLREQVATFTDAQLGQFSPQRRLARTWLGLHNAAADVLKAHSDSETPFAVFLRVELPERSRGDLRPELVKSLIDGVVAGFQAHCDETTVDAVAQRIARQLGESPQRIAERLLDRSRAALGTRDRLVFLRGLDGVQWNPGDHNCVAGQVLRNTSAGPGWELSGEVWTVEPRR